MRDETVLKLEYGRLRCESAGLLDHLVRFSSVSRRQSEATRLKCTVIRPTGARFTCSNEEIKGSPSCFVPSIPVWSYGRLQLSYRTEEHSDGV